MIHNVYEDEHGRHITELDAEGIRYTLEALEELLASEPGTELATPSFVEDDDGGPGAGSEFVFLRAEDVDTPEG